MSLNRGYIPRMLQIDRRALVRNFRIKKDEPLLVRGGVTSVGLGAAAIV